MQVQAFTCNFTENLDCKQKWKKCYEDEENFVEHANCGCDTSNSLEHWNSKKKITQKFMCHFLGILKLDGLDWNMDKINLGLLRKKLLRKRLQCVDKYTDYLEKGVLCKVVLFCVSPFEKLLLLQLWNLCFYNDAFSCPSRAEI